MSITEKLVLYVRARSISAEDQRAAALFLLDAFAGAMAGSATPVGRKLIAWSRSDTLNLRSKAFLMGTLAHITETDDLHRASVTHPGCVVVPSVLAAAQRTGANGGDVLAATLKGFEVMCRVGRAVGPAHYKVWHNTATCGPFGSAMAVSELYKLTPQQCVYALGNAGTQSSGLWQFLKSGAMSKHLHAGRASETGMLAAELAEHDFSGAADILEGEQGMFKAMCPDAVPDAVLSNQEATWELMQTSIKPWPSCRHTHPAIDAAIEIHAQLGNAIIERIEIQTYQAALNICDRPTVENEYQAKFSLQHCVAVALMQGAVSLDSFTQSARLAVEDLLSKTTAQLSQEVESRYPQSWGVSLTCVLTDGRVLEAHRVDCKGDPELALTDDEMVQKAIDLMMFGGLSKDAAMELVRQVLDLPNQKATVNFMDSFMEHVLA